MDGPETAVEATDTPSGPVLALVERGHLRTLRRMERPDDGERAGRVADG